MPNNVACIYFPPVSLRFPFKNKTPFPFKGEEKALKTVMAEQSRLGKALYRGQQIAQNYLNECKNIETDSHRLETAVNNYGKTFKDQNKELIRQSEIAYNAVCIYCKIFNFFD